MTHGNHDPMGQSWEEILGRYSEDLREQTFSTLAEYTTNFIDFLDREIFSSKRCEDYLRQFTREAVERLAACVNEKAEDTLGSGINRIEKFWSMGIEEEHEECLSSQITFNLDVKKAQDFKTHSSRYTAVSDVVEDLLSGFPINKSDKHLLVQTCLHNAILSPAMSGSGISFAGYGDAELFPSLHTFKTNMLAGDVIQFQRTFADEISLSKPACIRLFGWVKDIHRFLNCADWGLSGDVKRDIDNLSTSGFVESITRLLVKNDIVREPESDSCSQHLADALNLVSDWIRERIEEVREDHNAPLLRNTVESFERMEMASVARDLISLVYLKDKMTILRYEGMEPTVDVVSITQTGGFERINYAAEVASPLAN
jgi:hypothetical protein